MPFRSALEVLLDRVAPKEARLGWPKTDAEATRANYVAQINGYRRSLKIVAGEANGKLFDRNDLAEVLRSGLMRSQFSTLQLVFHKHDAISEAKKAFEVDNAALLQLKLDFPKRVHLYWSPIRPRQHYAVIDDGDKAILEEPNHEPGQPFWATVVMNKNRAAGWSDRFDKYVQCCKELEFISSRD